MLSVAVSHDGNWIVSGSKDRGVQFWDARSAITHCMLQGHKNSGGFLFVAVVNLADSFIYSTYVVISIALNPANNLLATGSGDNLARVCKSLV